MQKAKIKASKDNFWNKIRQKRAIIHQNPRLCRDIEAKKETVEGTFINPNQDGNVDSAIDLGLFSRPSIPPPISLYPCHRFDQSPSAVNPGH